LAHRPEPATDRSATYRQVFASREFRYLVSSHAVSLLGDQALRVGLALLVYHDSSSPLLTAFAYSLTFLPWVVAGPALSGYADRLPRRTVLFVGNLARAVVVGLMTIPGLPIGVLLALVFLAEAIAPPVDAASFAVLPDLLEGDRYVVGVSLNQGVTQASQILGFGLGGAIVAHVGARAAFGADAASFLIAALVSRFALRQAYHPERAEGPTSFWADTREGFRVVLGRRGPRTLLLIAWWGAAVLLVPEALAAPFVARVAHGGDSATGWLLAALPTGMIIGMVVLGRFVRPSLRSRLMRPLAVASAVPLIGFAFRPSLAVALGLLVLSGMAWSFQVPLQGMFIELIPHDARGRAFGVAAAGIQIAQGLGILVGGALAEVFGVTAAITAAGIAGVLVMLRLALVRVPAAEPALPVTAAAT
jgi:predicted MFS family arabinose efflux permease